MYGMVTTDSLTDELLNTYSGWDNYVAHIWYCLLHFCDINSHDTIVEVAPGSSSKIAQALRKADFRGHVYIVEPYADALAIITERYTNYLPQATIHPIQKYLAASLNDLPANIDFLVSHHPLDDMILSSSFNAAELAELFNWVTGTKLAVHPLFQQRWQQLEDSPHQLEAIYSAIINEWQHTIQQLKPRTTIVSQYPSLVLNNFGMQLLNQAAQQLLWRLKRHYHAQLEAEINLQTLLNANKNYGFELIATEVLCAKNWLMHHFN